MGGITSIHHLMHCGIHSNHILNRTLLHNSPPASNTFTVTKPKEIHLTNSSREILFLEFFFFSALQKHIAVDIYGKCGTLKCSRSDENACWRQVNADYFFYLSFENSICADYVTEKFFNAMNQSVVPVVLGGANYGQMAPPQSVIDVWKDYRNDPGQLAKVLQNLIDDKQSYAQYFWWKDFYRISDFNPARHFCQICEKLHQKEATTHSSYQDLEEWWEHSARCKKVHVRNRN